MSSAYTPLKLLLLSTPVGPIGSGLGGGVELSIQNLAQVLQQRGYGVTVVAPVGSILPEHLPLVEIPGQLQTLAQAQGRDAPITLPTDGVLANMWHYARRVQQDYDVLINFAYDWLPFYLTPFFHRPIAHLISMGSLTSAMDQIMAQVVEQFPTTLAVHSQTQAATFSFGHHCRPLYCGLDLSLYEFCGEPEAALAWVGRIAPEKALEDTMAAVQKAKMPLKIMGKIQDQGYWSSLQAQYPDAPVEYCGFLPTHDLQRVLRRCRALLVTPRWVEAFGIVVIEALACGVPVIAYRRGGPTEILRHGVTGWLVEADQVGALVAAIARIDELDRWACRQQAVEQYSLSAFGDRVEAWLHAILDNAS